MKCHNWLLLLQERFNDFVDRTDGQHESACREILEKFEEWAGADSEHLCSLIFDLFDDLDKSIPKSDESSSRDFGPESISLIHSFARRILVGFHSMSFEQLDILLTELSIYTRELHGGSSLSRMAGDTGTGAYKLCKGTSNIEAVLEREMASMRAGIQNKNSLLDKLEKQCDELQALSEPGYSKSILHARTTVALEKKDDTFGIDSMYEYSDTPESSLTRRVLVKEENRDETHRGTIIEAALNVAMVQARLGRMKDAMKMIREHMRVSQQSSNSEFLAYSLAALCYILSKAVPGSVELQTATIPSTTSAERHYLELNELLKKLFARGEQGNMPEIALYAQLSLVEMALLHPKKQKDSGLGSFDHTYQWDAQDKKIEYSSPGFRRIQEPCMASTLSLDACLYAKDLAYELALLSAGGPSKANSILFTAPRSAGTLAFSQSDSTKKIEAMQSCQTAEQIRSAGWLLWGSTRLSLSSALRVLQSSHKNDETEVSSLSLIMINLYEQFGAAIMDRLSGNERLQILLKGNILLQRSWDIVNQKRAVHARQSRLAIKLAARVHVHPKTNEVTHLENIVERRELTALAYLSGGYYEDADKAALSGYTLARNACMSTYALRLLLLRGRIHIESGSWETGTPYICSVLEQYRDISADVIGAEASMYMAHIWSRMGSQYIERALEEMDTCMCIILAHASLETRGIARLTLARLLIQQDGGFTSISRSLSKKVLRLLRDAEADFSKICDWKQKAYVLHFASIIYDGIGAVQSRDECAQACLHLRNTMEVSGNKVYIHL